MTERPSDREIDRLLAGLPRQSASTGFSRRVLAGLDRAPRPHPRRRWLLAVAAAAASLAVGLLWLLPRTEPQPSLAETRALQEEHRLLMEELESLKASLRQSQAPVLYLGGNENLDLILDLGPVWQGEARPAVYSGTERPIPAPERRTGEQR